MNIVTALIENLEIDPQTYSLSLNITESATQHDQPESTLSARDVG